MSNPWDPLPFPLLGDDDPYDLYAAVGVFVSEWESVELKLAQLYCVFVGDAPDGEALWDYGKPRIFSHRLDGLAKVAGPYFTKRHDQHLEGQFGLIYRTASGYSERRNEIAHGIVMHVGRISFFIDKMKLADPAKRQYLVVPPYHSVRNHKSGFPSWAYNRAQITFFATRILEFGDSVAAYRKAL